MNNQNGGLGMRQILNAIIVVVGLPLCWSMLAGMYGVKEYDPIWLIADEAGYGKIVFPVTVLVSGILFFADEAIERYQMRFANDLYGLLKDIGEAIKAGASVEAAVHKAAGWKKTAAAGALNRAMQLTEQIPFDAALKLAAEESGQPAFREAAALIAGAANAGGDIGPSVRWLAGHFARLNQSEVEFGEKLSAAVTTMRGVALFAVPALYRGLEWSLSNRSEQARTTLNPATVSFFAWAVVWVAMLDGFVYGNWHRVPAKIPFYLGICRTSMGAW
jgi:hypothetical protein